MENLLKEKAELFKLPKTGEIVEGKVIGKGSKALYLDLGAWGAGIIYGKEFIEARNILRDLKIGDTIWAKIVDLENDEGYIELSLSQASSEMTWSNLNQKKESGEIFPVKIQGANKGGLLAEVSNIPAFLPVSQLAPEHYPRVEGGDLTKILKELQKFVGKDLEVKVFDLDPKTNKLILSEKAKDTEKLKEMLKNYNVGDIVEGEITGVVNFGAFMKFGPLHSSQNEAQQQESNYPLEGLIHISELDWQLIEDPNEIVKVGTIVKAKIIEIADNRVSLSLKALKTDPWQDIEAQYKKGDEIKGKVTKINPFGAFVRISPKIQGLCHISEFGTQKKMEDSLKVGEDYNFEILLIDIKNHKISLKLK